jgi:hypothetical protein
MAGARRPQNRFGDSTPPGAAAACAAQRRSCCPTVSSSSRASTLCVQHRHAEARQARAAHGGGVLQKAVLYVQVCCTAGGRGRRAAPPGCARRAAPRRAAARSVHAPRARTSTGGGPSSPPGQLPPCGRGEANRTAVLGDSGRGPSPQKLVWCAAMGDTLDDAAAESNVAAAARQEAAMPVCTNTLLSSGTPTATGVRACACVRACAAAAGVQARCSARRRYTRRGRHAARDSGGRKEGRGGCEAARRAPGQQLRTFLARKFRLAAAARPPTHVWTRSTRLCRTAVWFAANTHTAARTWRRSARRRSIGPRARRAAPAPAASRLLCPPQDAG